MSPRKRQRKFTPRKRFKQFSKNRKPGDALTRLAFCERNTISESTYHALKREGRGPREIKLGSRTLITEQAEADWRTEREAETTAKREAKAAASHQQAADTANV
jgi:hypothetical protein